MNLTEYLEWLGIFEEAEYLPNIIQVLDSLPTWQDPCGDGTVYPCENECPYMKQFINEDKDESIETNH